MEICELFNVIRNMLKHNLELKYEKFYFAPNMCSFKARKKVKGWIEIWLMEDHILFTNVFNIGNYQYGSIKLNLESIKKQLYTLDDFYNVMKEINVQEYYITHQKSYV
jgi:hypothetical protein